MTPFRRILAATALLSTCAAPLSALDLDAMSDAERDAFGEAVRSYLMENPQVIVEVMNILEAQQAEADAANDAALVAANMDALVNDGVSWVGGNPEGDITVVEFVDYRCGFCRRAHPAVEELIASDGNIRLVVKEFPILGEASLISSRFALAARRVGGDAAYKAAHDALITMTGDLSDPVLTRLATTLGLDPDEVLVEMEAAEITQQLRDTRALAQALQINGTPSFVMGDEMVRGFIPLEAMQDLIASERNEG